MNIAENSKLDTLLINNGYIILTDDEDRLAIDDILGNILPLLKGYTFNQIENALKKGIEIARIGLPTKI